MVSRHGFQVLTAGDGREAVRVFQEHVHEVTCVLLDLSMPRMSGEEAFRELRRLRPDVPVIVASGYTEEDIRRRFAGHERIQFIEKPYRSATVTQELRKLLG
jgi:CheY-like chemotaxis protein